MGIHHGIILRILRDKGPQSRSALARSAGLSPTTLTHIAAQLLRDGTIAEVDPKGVTTPGRPATLMRIIPGARHVAGVHIGAGSVQVAICDLAANVLGFERFDYADGTAPLALVAPACDALRRLAHARGIRPEALAGLGVAVLGPVDAARRVNLLAFTMGWRDVGFADAFEAELGVPTVLEHNISAMALAERFYGLGRHPVLTDGREGVKPALLYVSLGRGLGAGLVVDDRVFRPGGHGAVEIGHVSIDPQGRLCRCGNRGCLETLFADLPPEGLAAEAARDRITPGFVTALAGTVNILSPDLIVLGGRLADAPDAFLDRLRAEIPPRVLPHIREGLRFGRGSFGIQAGAVGGAAVALDHFIYAGGPR
ncbi:MAG: ROK family transcriptional regulator [Paracoccus sp. (in: a-proteobacteria)]|nr:ROK family transcriptional regulator [Paracoccus sp. (in: a-proteobacteria)]